MNQPAFWEKIGTALPWLPSYFWQRCIRRLPNVRPLHLLIGIADHFEPMNRVGSRSESIDRRQQEERLRSWCEEYPAALGEWRDDDGRRFRHTYFYPAEDFDGTLLDRLAEHCHRGWGEIEIHLHHGVQAPDTRENTFRTLVNFRDALVARGCLCQQNGTATPRYAFVHGNWALANSDHGRFCGVDEEMQILADTGCYADFTLPAPSRAQISKINSLYECALPLDQQAPHRRGMDLQRGRSPDKFPLIVQGPLMVDFGRKKSGWPSLGIESSELSGVNPPSMRRMQLWKEAAIRVQGSDWIFIKLHCHGLQSTDKAAMLGAPIQTFLKELLSGSGNGTEYRVHFVTMREMVNIALAACDGWQGNPTEYRDYRFKLLHMPVRN
jgi:hypothetical protein